MNNEILKQLKQEAQETFGEGLGGYYYRLDEDKFAELIIKECVNICETACLPIDVNMWRDMTKLAMSAYTARALAEEIKKHFGL